MIAVIITRQKLPEFEMNRHKSEVHKVLVDIA